MTLFSEMTTPELFTQAKDSVHKIYSNVLNEQYKNITNPEHRDIKMYSAIDRTKMYFATLLNSTFYTYELSKYQNDRKALIKVIEEAEKIDYDTVRDAWYNELRELFYAQKEQKKIAERLSSRCILVRNETIGEFVTMINGQIQYTKSISEASEFQPISLEKEAITNVENKIKSLNSSDQFKVFFSNKMLGRSLAQI